MDVVGIHMYEKPKNPDLTLHNDGDKTPEEQVEEILKKYQI